MDGQRKMSDYTFYLFLIINSVVASDVSCTPVWLDVAAYGYKDVVSYFYVWWRSITDTYTFNKVSAERVLQIKHYFELFIFSSAPVYWGRISILVNKKGWK